jgi:hypothetical protein
MNVMSLAKPSCRTSPQAVVRIGASEERIVPIFMVIRIGEPITMLAVATEARCMLQEPHGVTSEKTAFFNMAG